ncbi:glycosyltransferase family 2 protein [bacterium]|nr:glycosyltransferase family 2 protein [bacterium]
MISRIQQLEMDSSAKQVVQPKVTGVSLIVPCFNEQESINQLDQRLSELLEGATEHAYDFEFIFVDDGSTDETWSYLQEHFGRRSNTQLLRHPTNQGMMAAVMTGVAASENEIVCSIDSDCTYSPMLVLKLLPLMKENVAMATASPYHAQGNVVNVPRWRIWLSQTASWLYGRLLKNKISCYTCAFRAYRRDVISDIKLENKGFVGTTEMAWRIDQHGWVIRETPATLNVRQYGQSKMRTFRVMMRHLKMLLKIGWNRLLPRPKRRQP